MKLIFFLISFVTFSAFGQAPVPGLPGSSEFYCTSGALYVPVQRRIGTFQSQKDCLHAVANSKWGWICVNGALTNTNGYSLFSYFDQKRCLISLRYSTFAPSRICDGPILRNFAGGYEGRFASEDECLEAMGRP
jgi:hypothetical protein